MKTNKSKVMCIALTFFLIFSLAVPAFAAASVSIYPGDGQTVSSGFLDAKQVTLTGKLYKVSGHGAYFTVLKEQSNSNTYVEDKTVFYNYIDTGSKIDDENDETTRYREISFVSTKLSTTTSRKTRINPYRVYNDVRATASISKLS